MKKLLFCLLVFIILTVMVMNTNEFAVWFNTENFYQPIYSSNFDVMTKGTSILVKLKQNYDVPHGFSLVFPCDNTDYRDFTNLDGRIRYKFFSDKNIFEEQTIFPPERPICGMNRGICDLILFTFDLPYTATNDDVFLEVTIESPITKLEKYRDTMRCKISPAYWPK